MSDQHVAIYRLVIQAVIAVVLLVAMTWIVLSPATSDTASKAALVVVSSAMGFLLGKHVP
jgi:hypothetical protein